LREAGTNSGGFANMNTQDTDETNDAQYCNVDQYAELAENQGRHKRRHNVSKFSCYIFFVSQVNFFLNQSKPNNWNETIV
jgi:hypothetical protein